MAPLSPQQRQLIVEALESRRKKEDFETSLSRALRRRQEGFDVYVSIMGHIREEARRRKLPPEEAARALTTEG